MSKVLLITGATGKQGGATIDALLASPSFSPNTHTIVAVSRDPASPAATTLAGKSVAIKVIQGDFKDIPALFKTAADVTAHPVYGVFSVQLPMGKGQSVETEERYGKGLVDEALKRGVKQFVYASVERGGNEASWGNPTDVPHFVSKHRVEHHLRDEAGQAMGWTILRPVAFMDNVTPGFFGKVFGTLLRDALGGRKLQVISSADIGWFAAEALLKPDEWRHKAVGLAADEVDYADVERVFQKQTGGPAPTTYGFVGSGVLWASKEMGTMFNFFRTTGYHVDIQDLRRTNPALMNFETWMQKKSAFGRK